MAEANTRPGAFPDTHWTAIHRLTAAEEAVRAAALADLCQTYWRPLYALARGRGHAPADAEDLTQTFLAEICARGGLGDVSQEKGRLRSFIKAAFRYHLADAAKQAQAQRRGGQSEQFSLDFASAERQFQRAFAVEPDQEALFDRQWALAVLQRTLAACRTGFEQRGKAAEFDLLKVFLTPTADAPGYAEIGARLGRSENTIAAAVKRLRSDFRTELRRAVADTVANPTEVDDELRHLVRLL
ncbi:MAG: sigma-70 family RNA polymerase sigma factor [Proteobacteria bacterium]|nr:sigma-70 family RNA polymerase sigma factor [Pseudomonadota bacterium]